MCGLRQAFECELMVDTVNQGLAKCLALLVVGSLMWMENKHLGTGGVLEVTNKVLLS